jgi:hypothetical protein
LPSQAITNTKLIASVAGFLPADHLYLSAWPDWVAFCAARSGLRRTAPFVFNFMGSEKGCHHLRLVASSAFFPEPD